MMVVKIIGGLGLITGIFGIGVGIFMQDYSLATYMLAVGSFEILIAILINQDF